MINELSERSREIFRHIVEAYVDTGEPVGSRTLSRRLKMSLSPATIRNVMADLEEADLLYAPHTSAGRLPTEMGLRLFVDGMLEVGNLTPEERAAIDKQCESAGHSIEDVLSEATAILSGLSSCAGVVVAPKSEGPLKHVEFVALSPGRALVVMVFESGVVENRVIDLPPGITPSALVQATNYLNSRLAGRTIEEARAVIQRELEEHTTQLDELTARVVETGLATWAGGKEGGTLIVRGHANLLNDVTALSDLERVRKLFDTLETKKELRRLLELTQGAEGVKIFIGAENELFALTDCSMVVAPYSSVEGGIIGAIGVIGPTRLNYARIIPMVDYTANVIGDLLGKIAALGRTA
ncbi:MAG: heat-inducible transcriptional repressor HrcA [Alphaproteobacteria bacterium]